MNSACVCCGNSYPGLWWTVPDAEWLEVFPSLGVGVVCPWCFSAKRASAGLPLSRAKVHLGLSHLEAPNYAVLTEMHDLDCRIMREGRH